MGCRAGDYHDHQVGLVVNHQSSSVQHTIDFRIPGQHNEQGIHTGPQAYSDDGMMGADDFKQRGTL